MVSNILSTISRTKGSLRLSDPAVLSAWITLINDAAREMYEQNDLLDQCISRIFDLSDDSTQILALPWYVYIPKKYRNVDTGDIFQASQQSARFQTWSDDFENWIFVRRSPLFREILNAGPFEFRLQKVETSDVTIKLSGQTPKSSYVEETLIIPAGTTSKVTTNNWFEGTSISQTPHTYDTDIFDIDGVQLSTIPNHLSTVSYTHYRREDDICPVNSLKGAKIEVLFKPVFRELLTQDAVFQCGSRYDDAIVWKTLERDALLNLQNKDLAVTFGAKCLSSIINLSARSSTGDNKIDFGRNRYLAVQEDACFYPYNQNRFLWGN